MTGRRALPLLVCSVLAACGSPQAKLTESQEYYAGRAVGAKLQQKYPLVDDPKLTEYVNLVGYVLVKVSDRPETFKGYTFGVLDKDEPNAFAAPSGFIFVTKGLLKMCRSEDELAGVLAHEIGHVCLKHPELAFQKAMNDKSFMEGVGSAATLASGVLSAFGRQGAADTVQAVKENFGPFMNKMVESLVTKGYERDQEFEADLRGIDFVVREGARYDPNGLIAVLQRLAESPTKSQYGWMHGSTHPDPKDRVERATKYIRDRGYAGTTDPARTARFAEMMKLLN